MALDTVADYLTTARTLLQDTFAGSYRYSDAELVTGLNLGLQEVFRLRPDMYIGTVPSPNYSAASAGTPVVLDVRYRTALLYYVCGHAQMRDEEQTEDARTAGFMNKFVALMTIAQS